MSTISWQDYYSPVEPWEQLVLWGKTPREVARDWNIQRAAWGERHGKDVVCVPCLENKHNECVKPCVDIHKG